MTPRFRRLVRSQALLAACLLTLLLFACAPNDETTATAVTPPEASPMDAYTSVRLETDLPLSEAHENMIPLLIEAAREMDAVFWKQAYGEPAPLLDALEGDLRRFAEVNYGPWDRLDGNEPFIETAGPKPAGANFYPADLTKEEFESTLAAAREAGDTARADALISLYTLVRRTEAGDLTAVPYSKAFGEHFQRAAAKLREAAEYAEDEGLRRYLTLRADALLSDDYLASDLAWMDMKDNVIDVIIGPIETYEDQLMGAKAAAEAFILVKDTAWSERLDRYASMLPELQQNLPVDAAYRTETPGSDSQLNAYDALYYAGDSNAGSKTIAINLPNDERVQAEKGSRRLQLKNSMRAKFEEILMPISGLLIAEEQREHITFNAFFANTMFHEVAHGLGINNTITGRGTVREALQERASALEEGKADVLGLFMLTQLEERGELDEGTDLQDNMVTFLASIFRSIRFGSSSAHGTANLIRFNYFDELGAFTRDEATGTYRVDFDAMRSASNQLANKILTLQGDGDYEGANEFFATYAVVGEQLQADLGRLGDAGIPVDIVFEQGLDVLGLGG